MNILELDEAQGLTAEMVRGWLNRNSDAWRFRDRIEGGSKDHAAMWISRNGCHGVPEFWLTDGDNSQYWEEPGDVAKTIDRIIKSTSLTAQALLREISPRMRRGMPSLAAWEACSADKGLWLAVWDVTAEQAGDFGWFAQRPIVTTLRRYDDTWDWGIRGVGFFHQDGKPEKTWSFWPCDAHGNKVPWPTKDGVML